MRRSLLLALAGLALAPASAQAVTRVQNDTVSGVVTIIDDDGVNNAVSVKRIPGSLDEITDSAGTLSGFDDCSGSGTVVTCPQASSYSVDVAAGDDSFTVVDGLPTPISVSGGPGNDDLRTGSAGDVLAGGEGGDFLDGNDGPDELFGETGNDTIEARDARAERIACGQGTDEVRNDPIDIIAECERGVDADNDGFSAGVDCNDNNAGISPGAAEIFDNGVDENCDGRDNPNLDVDGDGVPRPLDCDDGNPSIRPTVPEIRGNKVDENCDRRALAWAPLGATVSNQWAFSPSWTRLQRLVVVNAPRGARISMKCSGRSCPTNKTRRVRARSVLKRVVLHKGFRKARLRPGAIVRVTITAPQTVGRTYTYKIARGDPPVSTIKCRAPGAKRSRSC